MRKMTKMVTKIFLAGLVAVFPIVITISLVWWLGATAEKILGGKIIEKILGENYRFGMGIAAGIVVTFLVGLALHAWFVRRVFNLWTRLFERIPIIKTIYGAAQDLIAFISPKKERSASQVVMVTLGHTGLRLVGLVTREDFSEVPDGVGTEETVAVYMPMSYQMGGYTAMVPRTAVEPVAMSVEEGMRYAMTAGMSTTRTEDKSAGAVAGQE